jgi:ATP-dependent RNA helicase DHX37/DHR1
VFDQKFPQFTDPEILQVPCEQVILQMKNMGIQSIEKFPFPTPPSSELLKSCILFIFLSILSYDYFETYWSN